MTEAAGGVRPTPLELAELLWLARHMEPPADTPAAPAPRPPTEDVRPPEPTRRTPPPLPPNQQDSATSPPPESPRAPLHLPAPARTPGTSNELHTTLLAPAPPMLRHPLALQRSLRPLKRRTDAPDRLQLDERATADRIARLGAAPKWWLPVLRPAQERWLRLNLVYDAGPTMPVWRPLVRELHTALAQSGIFRTVTLHRAEPDGTVRHHGAHTPADGRTVTLLVSDCMGPQWRQGPAGTLWHGTLRRWAHRMPLAVVQPLPEHLWRDTALPTTPGLLSAPHPAAPNTALAFTPYERDDGDGDGTEGFVPLPVLEPGPRWLANWASLIAAASGQEVPGAAARLSRPLPTDSDDRTDVTGLSAEELVLRFRAAASPEAYRLAGHLALGRPDLPVMRLVQAALEPHPRPQHLAEVILSGMLTGVAGPPGSYAFRPGVRELLLRGLPRTARGRTTELLARVGGLIDERAGRAPGEFRASTPAPGGMRTAVDGEAFATVSPESVRQLGGEAETPVSVPPGVGGRYRLLERISPSGALWRARDTEADRTVVVRLHRPVTDPDRREAFLRDARILQSFEHPGVVTVHDFGIEDDTPFVVMEYLDGIPLNALAAVGGYRLPPPLLVSIGDQLARALLACHEAGITHGGLEMTRVVLLPDGTVKLSLFSPGRTSGPQGHAEDLRAVAELLLELAAGTAWLVRPVQPDQLAHLPDTMRPWLADALDQLLSPDLSTRRAGLQQLTALHSAHLAKEAYDQRFYYLLGPLRVEGPDLVPVPPDLKPMLAMLLLKHGRKVTHEELAAGVWDPGEAPQDTMAELDRQASALRTLLGPGVLATQPDGYALHTSADFVDLLACERLVARKPRDRADYDRVLKLWRDGGPLAGVPGPAARTARARLQQLRLGLYRTRAELDLELGEFERAATDLAELLRAHPAREDFRRLYLIALRRQGRTEEALEAYEEYELSGGRNPELLALGRELREEFGDAPQDAADESAHEEHPDAPIDIDTAYGFVAAPDELPEGFIPPEDETPLPSLREELPEGTPLPRDEVPDSLFALEDALSAEQAEDAYDEPAEAGDAYDEPAGAGDEEPDVERRDCARYEFADGPQPVKAQEELRRLVTDLLRASGLAFDQYRRQDDDEGCTVLLEAYEDGGGLFRATAAGLRDRLAHLSGFQRLRVEFWQTETRDGEDEYHDDRPDSGAVAAALDASEARAVIAVSEFWHDVEVEGASVGRDPFTPLEDDTGWYLLVHP
ncbi:SAV_2336 N-terminal domain-related protein [Streptomyces sp. SA15]|uniref:SAV_2336 N-terminal domain-related protein n=1 Tax=Streptomyces sp. SA15 TaxID=934019 RepID=UPI00211B7B7C|nr:SAV_2336 N-terminal domain-related protein [Streptomyces sp. SA15]